VTAVDEVFSVWRKLLKGRTEVPISGKSYLIEDGTLTIGAGILQIRDYATANDEKPLLKALGKLQVDSRLVKTEFSKLLVAKDGLNYFGSKGKPISAAEQLPEPRKKPPIRSIMPKPAKVSHTA
jgi:hypothetical protein